MKSIISKLLEKNNLNRTEYKPVFYRLSRLNDETAFLDLLKTNIDLQVYDEIHSQIGELIKCKNPKTVYTEESLHKAAVEFFENINKEKYGVWVFYPWSNRLIHILDEEEFVFVRTSRNQNKITSEERKILATKKIGVIGLSVGQSVSITLAMERGCGELRLADFDTLELTNLNRIRTGLHNLGLAKVYSVAREISEIDPFLKVVCFPEGITEKNMDDFFTANGKLDLLIEESDGFDIKILCRYKARELQIPVLMEASDKCMIDVERFDLEPTRSILHGLVDHLDINTLKNLKTTEEKIPYMLDVLGLETASVRLKASMLEIEQSINTWPQLASAVTMGGGITADISRRILLNQYHESGRYHIDIEELVGDRELNKKTENKFKDLNYPDLTINEMEIAIKAIGDSSISDISEQDLYKIVEAAIIAPSAGNNQPWKFVSFHKKLFLFHDKKQSISWADYRNLISYISIGTAIENINLRSEELGYETKSELFPVSNSDKLIAAFSFKKNDSGIIKNDLHKFIASRCTNRKKGKHTAIEENIFEDIKRSSTANSEASVFFTDKKDKIERISKIVSVAERIRFLNPQGHHDFYTKELKWPDKGGSPN